MLLTRDTILKMVMFYYILYFVERSHDFYFLIETIVVDLYRVDKCLVDINSLIRKVNCTESGVI